MGVLEKLVGRHRSQTLDVSSPSAWWGWCCMQRLPGPGFSLRGNLKLCSLGDVGAPGALIRLWRPVQCGGKAASFAPCFDVKRFWRARAWPCYPSMAKYSSQGKGASLLRGADGRGGARVA